jgi:hypothetical protein
MSVALPQLGHVVIYSAAAENNAANDARRAVRPLRAGHETISRIRIGEKLAALKGCRFSGEYTSDARYAGDNLYFIPADTLLQSQATALGIYSEDQLFGGSVPHPFIATKSITHALIHSQASAPEGWTHSFPASVENVVLKGYTAFSAEDARVAAARLLHKHGVRIKPALGIGGGGQTVITALHQLAGALEAIRPDELARYGVVLEQNLDEVVTYSVGQVQVSGLQIAYYGTQHMTTNHEGKPAYGGSTLYIVRGNFSGLLQLKLPPQLRLAVTQAYQYDTAANTCFPDFIASRRNYDVAQGIDSDGQLRSGVLEQSWRLGGASPAEIAALEAFAADPNLRAVQATCRERYRNLAPPPHATVYFHGEDRQVGKLVKYSTIDRYEYFTE